MEHIGEFAAFGTAICWTIGALFFETATKRVGTMAVNTLKVPIATLFLAISSLIINGSIFPFDATPEAWFYLGISGFVGYVITDIFLFSAYKLISSRLATLCLALSPPFTAIMGYFFLGEKMGHLALLGMIIVLFGIFITVFAKLDHKSLTKISSSEKKGYIYAFIACIGQSAGLVLSKKGLMHIDAISATEIRAFVGTIGFVIVSLFYDRGKSVVNAFKDKVSIRNIIIGAITGPFIGVVLSLFASQRAYTGVVSSIIGMTPVLIIWPSIIVFKQKVKVMEIIGAVIAVAGTVIFFL